MAEQNDTGIKSLVCDAAIAQFLRVKMSGTGVTTAGASDLSIGTLRDASFAANDIRGVYLRSKAGTLKMVASGAITAGVTVYAAASGKVSSSGTVVEGVAQNASAADGDIVEVVPQDGANNVVSSSPTAGIGYATGAGGAVSQATDRTTGVTINKVCGAITTQATSLAAGAEVSFTVTNSTVAVGDVVVASIRSGPTTPGSTQVYVHSIAAGSFGLTLTNLHASVADTGAAIINFAILKAVSA